MGRKIVLVSILILAFALRLYKINNPIADWHSFRQADTAAVARDFSKFGFDPLRPRYDDLSNIQSGQDNPRGWRMVEFPLYQSIAYLLFLLFGFFSIEVWLRLVTIVAAVGSVYFIYRIGEALVNKNYGLIAAFLSAVLPFSVYYGRTILPEQLAVFFSLGALYFLIRPGRAIADKNSARLSYLPLGGAALFAALALLIKPTAVFLLFPLPYLAWKKYSLAGLLRSPWTYLAATAVFTPVLAWRYWIRQFPAGIPDYSQLLNGDGIRFKGAWFYWLFAERLGKLILGYWGIALLVLGLIGEKRKQIQWFLFWLALGILSYFSIFATGNVRHDYYQVIALPAIVLIAASGVHTFLGIAAGKAGGIRKYCLLSVIFAFMLAFSWYEVRNFYTIGNPAIIEAGKSADRLLPPDAKVIAPYNGDTALLYQINRQGWPIGYDIEDKIEKGATYYVSVNLADPEVRELQDKYKVIDSIDSYIILDLQKRSAPEKSE